MPDFQDPLGPRTREIEWNNAQYLYLCLQAACSMYNHPDATIPRRTSASALRQ
jgi:hypothetical protein